MIESIILEAAGTVALLAWAVVWRDRPGAVSVVAEPMVQYVQLSPFGRCIESGVQLVLLRIPQSTDSSSNAVARVLRKTMRTLGVVVASRESRMRSGQGRPSVPPCQVRAIRRARPSA